jgi:hypothetical protein
VDINREPLRKKEGFFGMDRRPVTQVTFAPFMLNRKEEASGVQIFR